MARGGHPNSGAQARGSLFPPPQSIRLRLRRRHGSLPPALSAGKYGFLDQDGLEVRSSGVGIDLGASAHVMGFAKVLNPVGVTGDVEDLFFFDENGVALSRGLDWMAMPRRRPMAAEPVFRALRARGTLPQKID